MWECPGGFYPDNKNEFICLPCYENCVVCANSEEKVCSKCTEGYYIDSTTNKCVKDCHPGFYGNSIDPVTCVKCLEGCAECQADGTTCSNCPKGLYLYSG